jgi:hypothetical protein
MNDEILTQGGQIKTVSMQFALTTSAVDFMPEKLPIYLPNSI